MLEQTREDLENDEQLGTLEVYDRLTKLRTDLFSAEETDHGDILRNAASDLIAWFILKITGRNGDVLPGLTDCYEITRALGDEPD